MRVERIRVPDEIKYALRSISERLEEIATLGDHEIKLSGLRQDEEVALDLFHALSPVDEIIDNINLVVSDLNVLSKSSRAFSDANPMRRYKLLVRTFFYEFSRFEDIHSLFTSWLQARGYITKAERKVMRQGFYESLAPLIKLRNKLLHDDADWTGSYSHEITILEGLGLMGMMIEKDGKVLAWEDHLGPICKEMASSFSDYTASVRTYWNMVAADVVGILITKNMLKQAREPYVGKMLFKHQVRLDSA